MCDEAPASPPMRAAPAGGSRRAKRRRGDSDTADDDDDARGVVNGNGSDTRGALAGPHHGAQPAASPPATSSSAAESSCIECSRCSGGGAVRDGVLGDARAPLLPSSTPPPPLSLPSTVFAKVVGDAAAGVGLLLWDGDDALWWGAQNAPALESMLRAALPAVQALSTAEILARFRQAARLSDVAAGGIHLHNPSGSSSGSSSAPAVSGRSSSVDRLRVEARCDGAVPALCGAFELHWEVFAGYVLPTQLRIDCTAIAEDHDGVATALPARGESGAPSTTGDVCVVSKAQARHALLLAPYQALSLILAEALIVACEERGGDAVGWLHELLRRRYAQTYASVHAEGPRGGDAAGLSRSPTPSPTATGGLAALGERAEWCALQQTAAARVMRGSVRLPPLLAPLQSLITDAQTFAAGLSFALLGDAAVRDAAALAEATAAASGTSAKLRAGGAGDAEQNAAASRSVSAPQPGSGQVVAAVSLGSRHAPRSSRSSLSGGARRSTTSATAAAPARSSISPSTTAVGNSGGAASSHRSPATTTTETTATASSAADPGSGLSPLPVTAAASDACGPPSSLSVSAASPASSARVAAPGDSSTSSATTTTTTAAAAASTSTTRLKAVRKLFM